MFRIYILFILISTSLYAININGLSSKIDLLSQSSIYIDETNSLSKHDIVNKEFIPNDKNIIGLGFQPNKALWIRFNLKNTSEVKLSKTLELANAITETIILYDDEEVTLDGMLNIKESRDTLHPTFKITIMPNEEKVIYIKLTSKISSLTSELILWNYDSFAYNHFKHKTYIFIFFAIIITLLLYNLMIMVFTKEKVYLYYTLYLLSVIFFQANYLGVAQLNLFSNEISIIICKASVIYVSLLIITIVLFTREFLNISQFKKLDKPLKFYLYITPLIALLSYDNFLFNMNIILLFLPLGLYIVFISFYLLLKGVKQAKYYVVGWSIVIVSLIFTNLKTIGFFDITKYFAYMNELSFSLEALLFSIALAHRIKTLNEQKNELDAKLISIQKDEKNKLQKIVYERTKDLEESLQEKDLLYRELNHRVKNNLAMVISLIKLQISNAQNTQTKEELLTTKNRIDSISKLYESLNLHEISTDKSTKDYFQNIENNIRINFDENVTTKYLVECNLGLEQLIYCGLIVNELLTNSFKYAFINKNDGLIDISLTKEKNFFVLIIKDNGRGFEKNKKNSLGLTIVRTLVEKQLYGTIDIKSDNGTKITIEWKKDD